MNDMNSQMNHYHHENPYHTFENVYTANHEHMIAPNMHDHMNMPNHYHSGKKDVYNAHHPHHHSPYSTFPNQHDYFSKHIPMKDHHHLVPLWWIWDDATPSIRISRYVPHDDANKSANGIPLLRNESTKCAISPLLLKNDKIRV
nr:hypothetical protein P5627_14820 [Bacillus safensis]